MAIHRARSYSHLAEISEDEESDPEHHVKLSGASISSDDSKSDSDDDESQRKGEQTFT